MVSPKIQLRVNSSYFGLSVYNLCLILFHSNNEMVVLNLRNQQMIIQHLSIIFDTGVAMGDKLQILDYGDTNLDLGYP